MKKSIKKFLVFSQALGWSALVASACTEDQVKTAIQNNINSNKSNDSSDTTTDQDATTDKNKANSEVSEGSEDKGESPEASKDIQGDQGKTLEKSNAKDSEVSKPIPEKGKMGDTTSSTGANPMEHGGSNPETVNNMKKNEGSSSGDSEGAQEKVTGQKGAHITQPSGGGAAAQPGTPAAPGMPTDGSHGSEPSPKEVK